MVRRPLVQAGRLPLLSVMAAVMAAALLAGCTTPDVSPEVRNSPEFQLGYADGCATATTRTAGVADDTQRNDALAKSSEAYRVGWASGFGSCGGRHGARIGDPLNETDPNRRY